MHTESIDNFILSSQILHVPVNYEAIIGGIQILPKKLRFTASFLVC